MKKTISGITIEVIQGDIASQSGIDAVVNAANARLEMGGGVAGAIHRTAGPGLEEECRPLAPIKPGEAVITGAHNLPNKNVIHCLGPVYGRDKPESKLLADCYRNALRLAEENIIGSIAFPAISAGAFGYPVEDAARVALTTVSEVLPDLNNVEHVRFVLFSENDLQIFSKTMDSLFS
ncbi:MAG: macro domain-containing protein [bacterium]